ncbi:MAG: hypothetical protein ACK4FB_13675 [Brevundimonas sp.]|uniref:hypothetical protein n=1 Tax=Brevundimonas sp. TaxID=1871086 RepID=UPI00391C6C48
MSIESKIGGAGAGCLGFFALFVFVFAVVPGIYIWVIEPVVNPAGAESRAAATAARDAEERALIDAFNAERDAERRLRDMETAEKAEADRQQIAANAEASRAATTAALERYAECTVRNRTPNACHEDWRPTPQARAMVEMMR